MALWGEAEAEEFVAPRGQAEAEERRAGGAGKDVETELLRRIALDLRKGAFENSHSQKAAAGAILWQLTIAKLREGNPGLLQAHGLAGS
ncbi:MAG: hypothetical protein JO305_03900 [Alphaproteobacteria bacterium]|nr:hypothetical protein [Alphaproteobacteria bacterium]